MVPRHAFITWLALLNRLSARGRQAKFNPSLSVTCLFCTLDESRDHLYFGLPNTTKVWTKVITKVGKVGIIPKDWASLIPLGEQALQRGTSVNILARIAFQACIYFIWLERNSSL